MKAYELDRPGAMELVVYLQRAPSIFGNFCEAFLQRLVHLVYCLRSLILKEIVDWNPKERPISQGE